jgi:hypothetical protein
MPLLRSVACALAVGCFLSAPAAAEDDWTGGGVGGIQSGMRALRGRKQDKARAAPEAQTPTSPARGSTCRPLAKAALADRSESHIKDLVSRLARQNYTAKIEVVYGKFGEGQLADARAPKDAGNDKDWAVVRVAPMIFDDQLTHGDDQQVAAILAHEMVHLSRGHAAARKPIFDREKARFLSNGLDWVKAKVHEKWGSCKEAGDVVPGKNECQMLADDVFSDSLNANPEYLALRRRQEKDADLTALDFMQQIGDDPWALWAVVKDLPEPPAKAGDPPNYHAPRAERAAAIQRELTQRLQLPQPCK